MPDTLALLSLSTRCLCIGVLIRSVELLRNRRELPDDRLLGWGEPASSGPLAGVWHWLLTYPRSVWMVAIRAVAAACCLALPAGAPALAPLLAGLVLAQLYCNYRFALVLHSSDTMFVVGLAAVCAGSLDDGGERLRGASLAFLGLHALVAYAAAGADKLMTPSWRTGDRLVAVFRDSANRLDRLGRLLAGRRGAATVLSAAVIALEILLPLSVVSPAPIFWGLVSAGLVFHAAIAVTMGLHDFFWSFAAAYPGLYYLHSWLGARLLTG